MEKETFAGHIMPMHDPITTEDINKFFEGSDPMKRIVAIELGYDNAEAEIVYVNDEGQKRIKSGIFVGRELKKNHSNHLHGQKIQLVFACLVVREEHYVRKCVNTVLK